MSCAPEDRDKIEVSRFDLVATDAPESGKIARNLFQRAGVWLAEKFSFDKGTAEDAGGEVAGILTRIGLAKATKPIQEVEKGRAETIKTFKETSKMDFEIAKLMAETDLAKAQALKTEAEALEIIMRVVAPELEALRAEFGHATVKMENGHPVFFVGLDVREIGPAIEDRAPAGETDGS